MSENSSMNQPRQLKILVYGINYRPEPTGIAVYSAGMAEWLSKRGHTIMVGTAQPYYPGWKIIDGHQQWRYQSTQENGVKVVRSPHYIPAVPSGLKRILHHFSFACSSAIPTVWLAWRFKPDIVIAVAPAMVSAPVAIAAAAISRAKKYLHVQDFEVDAAFATGLISGGGKAGRLALWYERRILSFFDHVSSISPQMCKRLAEKGIPRQKISEFRNWADIDNISPLTKPSTYRSKWGIDTPQVALYSGSIGEKQGIELIVDAARAMEDNKDISFVVCGEGPHRKRLEERAKGLTNIQFHNLQPMDQLEDLLGLATIHLLPQMDEAADLLLPSKLVNMMASGRPIVATTHPETGLGQEIRNCGFATPPGSVPKFVDAIQHLASNDSLRNDLGNKARNHAETRLAMDQVLTGFETILLSLVNQERQIDDREGKRS